MVPGETVSAVELGRIVGISGRAVRAHAAAGVLTKDSRGRYPFPGAVVQYCEHFRNLATGRGGTGAVASASVQRTRLLQEQADAAALKNKRERGELLDAGEVERTWTADYAAVRAGVLAASSRVASRLPHLTLDDVSVIDDELRSVLTERGEGGPS
jgi:terminase small subunit / prophage DNA-packing protein